MAAGFSDGTFMSCCTQAGENPANYMLDVAGGSAAGTSSGPDFVELYKASQRVCPGSCTQRQAKHVSRHCRVLMRAAAGR